jgi:hypothetical protein
MAQEKKWDWFDETTVNDEPWLISINDDFWPEAIEQIEAVARAMRVACG